VAKPFRVMSIEFNGSRYVLDREAAETLSGQFNADDFSSDEPFRKMLEDLRAALATETEEPAPANPFDDESEEPAVPWPERKPEAGGQRTEDGAPKCFFCGHAGEVVKGTEKDDHPLWTCQEPFCVRFGKPAARAYFEEGVR